MKIRIYYNNDGKVTGIVVISNDNWNLAEHIETVTDNFATFPLTDENMEELMDSADMVNLDTIKRYKGQLV